jgi:hypothetical protein
MECLLFVIDIYFLLPLLRAHSSATAFGRIRSGKRLNLGCSRGRMLRLA